MTDVAMIVACIRRYREHCMAPHSHQPLKVIRPADIVWPIPVEERIAMLLEDAVRSALRGKVRDIGWKAFTAGGLAKMQKAAAAVEDAMPDCQSFAGSTLDHWWDGIGSGRDQWTA